MDRAPEILGIIGKAMLQISVVLTRDEPRAVRSGWQPDDPDAPTPPREPDAPTPEDIPEPPKTERREAVTAPVSVDTTNLDSQGIPWDERIHIGTRKKLKKKNRFAGVGTWMWKRGIDPLVAQAITEELKAAQGDVIKKALTTDFSKLEVPKTVTSNIPDEEPKPGLIPWYECPHNCRDAQGCTINVHLDYRCKMRQAAGDMRRGNYGEFNPPEFVPVPGTPTYEELTDMLNGTPVSPDQLARANAAAGVDTWMELSGNEAAIYRAHRHLVDEGFIK